MPDAEAQVVITARYEDEAGPGLNRLRGEIKTLAADADTLAPLEENINRAAGSLKSLRDTYVNVMTDLKDITRSALEDYIAGSYMAVAEAMSMWVAGAKGGAREFAQAMLELSAQAVLAIGRQAAVKAVFAMAEFLLFKDPMALAAAKMYGAVAGMALAVGASLMGMASNYETGAGAAAGGGTNTVQQGGTTAPGEQNGGNQFTVNVHVQGHVVDTDAFVEDVVAPAMAEAVGHGAGSRGRYNLQVTRD